MVHELLDDFLWRLPLWAAVVLAVGIAVIGTLVVHGLIALARVAPTWFYAAVGYCSSVQRAERKQRQTALVSDHDDADCFPPPPGAEPTCSVAVHFTPDAEQALAEVQAREGVDLDAAVQRLVERGARAYRSQLGDNGRGA